eukprot:Gb_13580 [translate_table: standard]
MPKTYEKGVQVSLGTTTSYSAGPSKENIPQLSWAECRPDGYIKPDWDECIKVFKEGLDKSEGELHNHGAWKPTFTAKTPKCDPVGESSGIAIPQSLGLARLLQLSKSEQKSNVDLSGNYTILLRSGCFVAKASEVFLRVATLYNLDLIIKIEMQGIEKICMSLVLRTIWKVGNDGIRAGTKLVPESVPRPVAQLGVAVIGSAATFIRTPARLPPLQFKIRLHWLAVRLSCRICQRLQGDIKESSHNSKLKGTRYFPWSALSTEATHHHQGNLLAT